jgi:hypothetical protein
MSKKEITSAELSNIVGGQSKPDRGKELSDSFNEFAGKAFEFVAPYFNLAESAVKLGYAAENFVRAQVEQLPSRELTDAEAQQRDEQERQEKEKAEADKKAELGGGKQSSAQDVADFIGGPTQGEVYVPPELIGAGGYDVTITISEGSWGY